MVSYFQLGGTKKLGKGRGPGTLALVADFHAFSVAGLQVCRLMSVYG